MRTSKLKEPIFSFAACQLVFHSLWCALGAYLGRSFDYNQRLAKLMIMLTILVVLKLFSGALEHDVSEHSLESCIGCFADVVSSCEQRDFAAWGVEVGIVPSTLCSYSEPFAFRY